MMPALLNFLLVQLNAITLSSFQIVWTFCKFLSLLSGCHVKMHKEHVDREEDIVECKGKLSIDLFTIREIIYTVILTDRGGK